MHAPTAGIAPDLETPGPIELGTRRRPKMVRTTVFVIVITFVALNALVAYLEPVFMRWNTYDMQYESARIVDYYDAPRPDILFMGSSRAGWGFDPDVAVQEIARSTGIHLHALNLGISGSMINMNYLILKNIIRDNKKPRIIVYGLSELELASVLPNTAWNLPYFSLLLRPDDFPLFSGNSFGDKVNFLLNTFVPLYRDHELIRNGLSIKFNPDDAGYPYRNAKFLASGYTVWSPPHGHGPAALFTEERSALRADLRNVQFGGPHLARLRDFLQLAHRRGISVVLATVPVSAGLLHLWPSRQDINAYEQVVRSTAREYRVPLLDLYTNPGNLVPQSDFYDLQHLNKTGAALTTRVLTHRYLVPMIRARSGTTGG